MSANSAIEWTSATWNPIAGCSVLSPGCTNCYAMKMAARIEAMQAALGKPTAYAGLTQPSKAGPVWNGRIAVAPDETLTQPLRWKRPRRIFVNSMSDLFHEGVADETIDRVFAVMALCPQHTFQVLTKRAERMREWFEERWQGTPAQDIRMPDGKVLHVPRGGETGRRHQVEEALRAIADERGMIDCDIDNQWDEKGRLKIARFDWPLPNVWLGVSTEDQARADERIPHLLATPAAKRFISAEPLLGAINVNDAVWAGTDDPTEHMANGIDWVIAGGESGKGARPMHPDWVRSLRDQCAAAQVPFFFKQWGEWTPGENVERTKGTVETALWWDNGWSFDRENLANEEGHVDDQPDLYRVGKKAAGALLDGREHREFPT